MMGCAKTSLLVTKHCNPCKYEGISDTTMTLKSILLSRFQLRHLSWSHLGADLFLLAFSLWVSLWMRVGWDNLSEYGLQLLILTPIFLLIQTVLLASFGVYQTLWRFTSARDAFSLGAGLILSIPFMASVNYILSDLFFIPRSIVFIHAFVALAFLLGARMARRRLHEGALISDLSAKSGPRVVIYGAGLHGVTLAQRLRRESQDSAQLIGFIDDDPKLATKWIQGVPVVGDLETLKRWIEASELDRLYVAFENPRAEKLRELLVLCRRHRVDLKIMQLTTEPSSPKVAAIRPVDLRDLLSRERRVIDLEALRGKFQGKTVLVTGAGGSIGSELSRQLLSYQPSQLLLLDHSEYNLYQIDHELRPDASSIDRVVPLLIDLKDANSLERVFQIYRPHFVFHAAAYKHVHLVEANPYSSILNNISGTHQLLNLSERFNVHSFVLISTDKAVNPVGVMGATKRVCELMTSYKGLTLNRHFTSVRFGNVLGSSGSLVPLLQQQIREGGPLTLTHEDMTRYFMLIPEAISLVLTACTLSQPGDIQVLKMGDPVRVVDLARGLLALMGVSEEDIPIVFTGLRPGEKMYEELYLTGHELETRHPDILTVPSKDLSFQHNLAPQFISEVELLIEEARHGREESVRHLMRLASFSMSKENQESLSIRY